MNTILLIDDQEFIRAIFKMVLEEKGYRVIEAASGDAGFELAQEYLPDLILSDLKMPNGDGQTLLEKIRQNPALSRKQVVLMTGDNGKALAPKGTAAAPDDFLIKPVGRETLLKCVETRIKRALIPWRVEDHQLTRYA